MLKLKLQYFGHLIRRADIWKAPDAGKDWRWEEKGMTEDEMVGWHHQPNGHEFKKLQELVTYREAWRAAVHRVAKSQTWLNWTELYSASIKIHSSLLCFCILLWTVHTPQRLARNNHPAWTQPPQQEVKLKAFSEGQTSPYKLGGRTLHSFACPGTHMSSLLFHCLSSFTSTITE